MGLVRGDSHETPVTAGGCEPSCLIGSMMEPAMQRHSASQTACRMKPLKSISGGPFRDVAALSMMARMLSSSSFDRVPLVSASSFVNTSFVFKLNLSSTVRYETQGRFSLSGGPC
eukprot:SAG31_NODE_3_length_45830_cov_42.279701_20_plen_115_part_00